MFYPNFYGHSETLLINDLDNALDCSSYFVSSDYSRILKGSGNAI